MTFFKEINYSILLHVFCSPYMAVSGHQVPHIHIHQMSNMKEVFLTFIIMIYILALSNMQQRRYKMLIQAC